LTVGWLFDKVLSEISKQPDLQADLKMYHPLQLACKDTADFECVDFFLTLKTQPLATFLQAPRRGGRISLDLRLIATPIQTIQRAIGHGGRHTPCLGDFERIKVLGTGGFSQVLMGKNISASLSHHSEVFTDRPAVRHEGYQ
jgi:hypothetical protein